MAGAAGTRGAASAPAGPPPSTADARPILTVDRLSVRLYGRSLLEEVSFSVPAGATVAVVGPNGGGKTTLLRALLHRVPYSGQVRWSHPLRIGYVPQKLVDTDIPLTVEEFLRLKCEADYLRCLQPVGLSSGVLSEPIGALSAGEMQRVLIAWATVDRPEVLLFDEPTSNVDVGGEDAILQAVARVQRETGATVLLVTHDLHELHHYCDRVLVLHRRLLFDGTVPALLADSARVAEVFGLRAEDKMPFFRREP